MEEQEKMERDNRSERETTEARERHGGEGDERGRVLNAGVGARRATRVRGVKVVLEKWAGGCAIRYQQQKARYTEGERRRVRSTSESVR